MTARAVIVAVGLVVLQPEDRGATAIEGAVLWQGLPAAGAVVSLAPLDHGEFPLATDTVEIDQQHLRFIPSVTAIQAGTTVRFLNSDPLLHNVFSPERRGAGFDLGTYPQGTSRLYRFDTPGSYVVLCHVHPEMAAWVVVLPTAWFALSDESGRFRVADLAPGRYTLRVWYRRKVVDEREVEIGPAGVGDLRIRTGDPGRAGGIDR